MTNFEYYKEEILEIINKGNSLGVCKGKPVSCSSIECRKCISYGLPGCSKGVYDWLYTEHKEQPKLTKKERQFCELVETGWICRDAISNLWLFEKRPEKKYYPSWTVPNDKDNSYGICITKFPGNFSFITWDDAEPWSVEDLLKLEVEDIEC